MNTTENIVSNDLKHPRFHGPWADYVHSFGDLMLTVPVETELDFPDAEKWELVEFSRVSWVPALRRRANDGDVVETTLPCSVFKYENRETGAPRVLRRLVDPTGSDVPQPKPTYKR